MKNSIKNCLTVFQRDPLLRGAVSYNILSERVDIVKPLGWERTSATLTDMDMKYLLLYLEEHYGLTSEKKVENAIQIVANENRYHPVRDYLNSLQWDGTERIRYALHHFLGADTDEYTFEALKLFMMGAIRRVFQPGSKFEVMLCLVGGQGAGKSTFFRLLAVKDEWFSDDLKKLDDENVYRKLQGHWIMEMSEMIATANARSIEEIKSFLSRQKETYKVPYETHPADRLRQCVFGGTTNRQDFLPRDRTGNRRFIPVTVYPERAEVHILDDEAAARTYISQMWAEAMTIYRSGKYKLSFSAEMNAYLKAHQQGFMQEDTQAGMIYAYLEDYTGDRVCSKQLYEEALGNLNSCLLYTSHLLGLEDKLKNMPNNLSGGQQQRVAIARALITKPAIVLADEPTGNLDSKTSAEVLGLIKRTSAEFRQTVVMITHNDDIARLADRIIRIEDGKIVE